MAALNLSCGTGAPERMSSLVAAPGLSCRAAFGILVPRPGIEPIVPCFERWILNHWTTREVPGLVGSYSLLFR